MSKSVKVARSYCIWVREVVTGGPRIVLHILADVVLKLKIENVVSLQSQFYSRMMPAVFQSLQDMDEQRVRMIQVVGST